MKPNFFTHQVSLIRGVCPKNTDDASEAYEEKERLFYKRVPPYIAAVDLGNDQEELIIAQTHLNAVELSALAINKEEAQKIATRWSNLYHTVFPEADFQIVCLDRHTDVVTDFNLSLLKEENEEKLHVLLKWFNLPHELKIISNTQNNGLTTTAYHLHINGTGNKAKSCAQEFKKLWERTTNTRCEVTNVLGTVKIIEGLSHQREKRLHNLAAERPTKVKAKL